MTQSNHPVKLDELVNFDWLNRYTDGDASFELELLELFERQAQAQLDVLKQLAGTKNPEDWHLASHTLKGAARAVGIDTIGQCAEHLERLGPEGQCDAVPGLLRQLEAQILQFRAVFAAHRGNCLK